MEERIFHNKIIWFTFLFSFLVIWIHSYNAVLFLGSNGTAYSVDWMERFLGERVSQIAVPGFFMISSYLFFRGFTPERLKSKWLSRVRSILVPYILWNVIYYFGYAVGSRIPVLTDIIGKGVIPVNLPTVVDAIISYRYNYVFWYLHQLIFLILLAPVIYLLVRRVWTGVVWLAALLFAIYLGANLPYLNLDALIYYSAAAFAAVHGRKIAESAFTGRRCTVGIAIAAFAFFLKWAGLPGESRGELVFTIVVFRCVVPIALWLMVPEHLLPEAAHWMRNNFFLYAVHFAVVRLINKTGALLLPPLPVIPFVLYLVMPVLAVVISSLLGWAVRKVSRPAWTLLNGGR